MNHFRKRYLTEVDGLFCLAGNVAHAHTGCALLVLIPWLKRGVRKLKRMF